MDGARPQEREKDADLGILRRKKLEVMETLATRRVDRLGSNEVELKEDSGASGSKVGIVDQVPAVKAQDSFKTILKE